MQTIALITGREKICINSYLCEIIIRLNEI